MMILSQQMQGNLKELLRASPLADGELRRVEGMGELYVSNKRNLDVDGYEFLYSLEIEGIPYFFFGRLQ